MLVLAYDCSSTMSIALVKNHDIIHEQFFNNQAKHSELLIAETKNILNQFGYNFSDLNLVIATSGPGSYTGIRVALSFLKILNITLKIPCITVNSCMVSAQKYISKYHNIKVVHNGNVNEIYFAQYQSKNGFINEIHGPEITNLNSVLNNLNDNDFLCGTANYLFENHHLKSGAEDLIMASDVWKLGQKILDKQTILDINFENEISPLYLREPRITTKNQN